MDKINIKVFSSILLVGLLAGCASKSDSVTYDNKANDVQKKKIEKKVINVEPKQFSNTNNMQSTKIVEDDIKTNVVEKKSDSYVNEVVSVIDGKEIVLKSIHFGFDKYSISEEMLLISNDNVNKINNVTLNNTNVKIKLEGNCDEWGTDEYNYALGLKRTKSVRNALIKSGVSSDRIISVTYGESNPICNQQTAKCWKQNRRVDHKLLP